MGFMKIRLALFAAPVLLALTLTSAVAAAPAKKARPSAPAEKPLPDTVRISLTTTLGPMLVEVDVKHAPITASNFVHYVDQKRFDGISFYRVLKLNWGAQPNGLIQGGARGDPKRIFKAIAHEPTTQTGILHTAGTLSMARFAPGTATGDFFILLSDMPGFDAKPGGVGEDLGYAAFGHVVEGMDIARKVFEAPISPTLGEGSMRGQMIASPVKILTARRVP
jgi:peptidyl-prolyl cis-trans isomerase A (cyclophilin A)